MIYIVLAKQAAGLPKRHLYINPPFKRQNTDSSHLRTVLIYMPVCLLLDSSG